MRLKTTYKELKLNRRWCGNHQVFSLKTTYKELKQITGLLPLLGVCLFKDYL